MNYKQVIRQVKNHISTHPGQSMHNGGCKYKHHNGNACFIGIFMDNEDYVSIQDIEGMGVGDMEFPLPATLESVDVQFLERLQDLHDCNENWDGDEFIATHKLKALSKDWGVDYDEC